MENLEINNQQTKPAMPNSFLLRSIFAFIFFWPLGIPAILNTAKVFELWVVGNYAGANEASAKANKWSRIALICAIAFWAFYILLFFCYCIILTILAIEGEL